MTASRRVVFIHWNIEEAKPHVARLQSLGFNVEHITPRGGAGLRVYNQSPPDVFLIDLTRAPSRGRDIAIFLRQKKGTRTVPIALIDGQDEDKLAKTRQLLPDATFASWEMTDRRLRRAIMEAKPSVSKPPGLMAQYAGTPLARKLGVEENTSVVCLGAPDELREALDIREESATGDRVMLFARSTDDLENGFDAAARRVKRGGGLWVMWPKQSSGVRTDITQHVVRARANESGWSDYKICAVDRTWSGMLFARKQK